MNHSQSDQAKQDQIKQEVEENTVDPRDLVNKGGYTKHPREIVENPAVTPQMQNENEESRAGFIRRDRDEAES